MSSRSPDRATFNRIVRVGVEVCHQRAVRDAMGSRPDVEILFPTPPVEDLVLRRTRVREIGRDLAWKVIARYEWLGTLPSFCSRFFGLFFGDRLGGVACYGVGSVGAGDAVARRYGLKQTEIGYLARGACVHWAPTGSAPRLINFSARLLAQEGVCLALAYADTDAGEIGTVYQAAGWDCLGFGTRNIEYVSPQGRAYNCALPRQVIAKNKGRLTWQQAHQALLAGGWTVQKGNPKLRYVKVLPPGRSRSKILSVVARDRVPYPKRPSGDPGGMAEYPSAPGGSTPTSPLHASGEVS